jgi:hypothetical protein
MLTVLPNFLPLVASNLTWRGAPTTLPNRATVAHHLAHDCRASPVGSHRCLAAIGEEFLYCVKAAGFAGSASPVGRACGLRPVPPSWRHSDTIRSAAGHRTRSWAEQPCGYLRQTSKEARSLTPRGPPRSSVCSVWMYPHSASPSTKSHRLAKRSKSHVETT